MTTRNDSTVDGRTTRDVLDLLADPVCVAELPAEAVPAVLGELERLKAILWSRLITSQATNGHIPGDAQLPGDDDLLTATAAAKLLGMSRDWLYKNSAKLPFTRRVGPRAVRFSAKGIRRYLASRS